LADPGRTKGLGESPSSKALFVFALLADTAVHLIVARDPEDGQYYPVDSRTITDDIDVTVERGPDDVPAQVPIVKEQHLLDAVNLALAASEGGTDDHRDGEEDQPGSARSMA